MNKRYSIIFIALIFVLSGCANTKNKADSQNGINVYTETENNQIGIIEDTSEEIRQEYDLYDEEMRLSERPVHYDTAFTIDEDDSIKLRDRWFANLSNEQIEDVKNRIMELHMDIEYDLVYIFTSDNGPESAKWNNIDGDNSNVIDEYIGYDIIDNLEYTKTLIDDELYTKYVDDIIEQINYIIVNHDIDIYFEIHQKVHDLSYYVINYPLESFEIDPPDWHGVYVYFGWLDEILEEIKEDSEMSKGNQKIYQGKEFKFYKADSSLLPPDTSNIFEIYGAEYDEERNTYYEKYDASYHSLFIGQCLTLFGDADYQSDDNEDLLSYVVAAEDEDNNVIYMEIYYGPSGPAIGGVAFDDTYSRAAEELSQIIMDAEPTDFEITSTYGDLGATIEMGVKDGKAYYNTVWPDNYFDGIEDVM